MFKYYNSAYFPKSYSPLGVWVRHLPPNERGGEMRIIAQSEGWVHIHCPDRELLCVRNALTPASPRPLDKNWDEFVALSATNSSAVDLPYERLMINYFQHSKTDKFAPKLATHRGHNKVFMSDSGGFQVLTGKTEWIDPVDLAKWYNVNCDEGITLDIPTPVEDEEILLRSARVQAGNNKVIMDNLRSDFRLFNVIHGTDIKSMRKFREIVEKDGPDDYVCISDQYHGNMLKCIHNVLGFILDNSGKQYKQYHLLGIYNTAFLAPMIRAAALLHKKYPGMTISSDASTHLHSAGNRTMHLQRAHWRNAERLFLGKAAPVYAMNPYRRMPCSCPVCSTIPYVDVFSHVNSAILAHILMSHNIIEITRWMEMMNHYAVTLDSAGYKELVSKQFEDAAACRTALMAVDFVEIAINDSLDEAAKKYRPSLISMFTDFDFAKNAGSMYGDVDLDELRREYGDSWFVERLDKVLTRYEHYHDNGEAPTIAKEKGDNKRKVKKVMANKMVKGANTKSRKKKKKEASLEKKSKKDSPPWD